MFFFLQKYEYFYTLDNVFVNILITILMQLTMCFSHSNILMHFTMLLYIYVLTIFIHFTLFSTF